MQIVGDFLGQDAWVGQVFAVFQRIIFEPEDVEVGFVAFDDLFVGEAAPSAVGVLVLGPILPSFFAGFFGFVESDELVEVGSCKRAGFEGEVLIGAEVVDPQLFGPRFFLSWFVLEEQHVGFDALSVEQAGGQAEQCVDVALLQQVLADGLSRLRPRRGRYRGRRWRSGQNGGTLICTSRHVIACPLKSKPFPFELICDFKVD